MHVAAIQAVDDFKQVVERGRGGQTFEVSAKPRIRGGLHFSAHVDFGRRIVADEHDAEAGWPAGPRRERVHGRLQFGADLSGDSRAVEEPGAQGAASSSSFFNESGRPRTTSLSPGRMAVSGSGLNSIVRSCRWIPTTMTPKRRRRFAWRID